MVEPMKESDAAMWASMLGFRLKQVNKPLVLAPRQASVFRTHILSLRDNNTLSQEFLQGLPVVDFPAFSEMLRLALRETGVVKSEFRS